MQCLNYPLYTIIWYNLYSIYILNYNNYNNNNNINAINVNTQHITQTTSTLVSSIILCICIFVCDLKLIMNTWRCHIILKIIPLVGIIRIFYFAKLKHCVIFRNPGTPIGLNTMLKHKNAVRVKSKEIYAKALCNFK